LDSDLNQAECFTYSKLPIKLQVISDHWHQTDDSQTVFSRLLPSVWYLERVGHLAKQDLIDVFWSGANFLPMHLSHRCRTVLTVHDVVGTLYTETLSVNHRLVYKFFFRRSLRQTDRLVTNSLGTADRLLKHYGIKTDEVILPCARGNFDAPSVKTMSDVRLRYGLTDPYLLSVSTIEPRKNLESMLQALIELTRDGLQLPSVALVGQVGWKTSPILKKVEDAKSAGIRIVQLGYVPDEDLPALYGACSAFVFPSIYEGFGMPVLEALKCGAHVLASDIPEIREAGGDHATYFEPTVQGIKQALVQFLESDVYLHPARSQDPERLSRIAQHGSTWKQEGRKLANVIQSLV
jgi:glycosyltransferase involved in cell wall biosynthesis